MNDPQVNDACGVHGPIPCPGAGCICPSKGQAGGVLTPVAEMVFFRRNPSASEDCLPVLPGTAKSHVRAELVTRVVPLFTRPTPAAADQYQRVMNLPCNYPSGLSEDERELYLIGHRDARHAAAELVAASPAAAAPTFNALTVAQIAAVAPQNLPERMPIAAAAAEVPTGSNIERSFKNVAQGMVAPTVTVTLPAIQTEDTKSPMWDARDRIADALASPVAPAGAPPLTDEQIREVFEHHDAFNHWHGLAGKRIMEAARALLSHAALTSPGVPSAAPLSSQSVPDESAPPQTPVATVYVGLNKLEICWHEQMRDGEHQLFTRPTVTQGEIT